MGPEEFDNILDDELEEEDAPTPSPVDLGTEEDIGAILDEELGPEGTMEEALKRTAPELSGDDVAAILDEELAAPETPAPDDAEPQVEGTIQVRPPVVQLGQDAYYEEDQEEYVTDKQIYDAFLAAVSAPMADKRAAVRELAENLGADPEDVERNFEGLRVSWAQANFSPRTWRQQNPLLADVITKFPEAGTVVMGDEHINGFTKMMRGLGANYRMHPEKFQTTTASPFMDFLIDTFGRPMNMLHRFAATVTGGSAPLETDQTDYDALYNQGPPRQVPYYEDARAKEMRAKTGVLGRLSAVGATLEDSFKQQELIELGSTLLFQELNGEDTWETEKRIIEKQNQLVPRNYGQGYGEQFLHDAANQIPVQMNLLNKAGFKAQIGAAAGGVVGFFTNGPQGVPVGMLAGAKALGAYGMLEASFTMEAGSAYLEYRDMKTDDGQPIDPKYARGAAILYGILAAGIETASWTETLKSYGPLGEALLGSNVKAAIGRLLRKNPTSEVFLKALSHYAVSAGIEGVEEGFQQATQDLSAYAARSLTAGEFQRADPMSTFQAGVESAGAALGSQLVLGSAGPATAVVSSKLLHHKLSKRSAARIANITEFARRSKTAKESPEAAAHIVLKVTTPSGEPVSHLYADPVDLRQSLEGQGSSIEAALGPVAAAQAQAAEEAGGLLAVPVEKYIEGVQRTEALGASQGVFVTQPTLTSGNELKFQQEDLVKKAEALLQEEREARQKDPTKKPRKQSQTEINLIVAMKEQLAEAGIYDKEEVNRVVAFRSAFIRTLSREWGVKDDVLFGQYLESIERGKTDVVPAEALASPPNDAANMFRGFDRIQFPDGAEVFDYIHTEIREEGVNDNLVSELQYAFALENFDKAKEEAARVLAQFPENAAVNKLKEALQSNTLQRLPKITPDRTAQMARATEFLNTPEFKAWFGESKVVDRDGKPLVVFHGTNAQFEEFEDQGDIGFHFGTEAAAKDRLTQTGFGADQTWVRPFFLRIENPLYMDDGGAWDDLAVYPDEVQEKHRELFGDQTPTVASIQNTIRQMGHDGIIYTNDMEDEGSDSYVVFDPDQIKSVDNAGTFSMDTGNVYMQPAHHGSWAKEIKQFLFEHMSSGEGMQAFGYGFYFTQRLELAEHYRKQASGNSYYRAISPVYPKGERRTSLKDLVDGARQSASFRGDFATEEDTRKAVIKELKEMRDWQWKGAARPEEVLAKYDAAIDLAERTAFPVARKEDHTGQVYTVDLPEDDELAHWDSPMTDQPRPVLERLVAAGLIPRQLLEYSDLQAEWGQARKEVGEEAKAEGMDAQAYFEMSDSPAVAKMTQLAEEIRQYSNYNSPKNIGNWTSRTFKDFYYSMGRGGDLEANTSFRLMEAGIPGHKFLDGQSRAHGGGSFNFVIWDPDRIRIDRTYYQAEMANKARRARGYMKRIDNLFQTVFNPSADKSTPLHEFAHTYLEILTDLEQRSDVPASFKEKMEIIKDFLGADPAKPLRGQLTTAMHEKWAQTHEAWLRTGKAPSARLTRPFLEYRKWLISLYPSIEALPQADLNPEVVRVLERLVATDTEIAAMEMGDAPFFRTPAEMSKVLGREATPQEWRDYLDLQELAKAKTVVSAHKAQLQAELQEKTKAWKETMAAEKEKAEAAYDAMPEVQALKFLKDNDARLDHDKVVAVVGKEHSRKIPTAKDGMWPDELTDMFEGLTPEELLQRMAEVPTKAKWVAHHALQATRAQHPDYLQDRDRLRALIKKEATIHKGTLYLREIALLAKRVGKVPPKEAEIHEAAKRLAEQFAIGELKPVQVRKTEQRNWKKAGRALALGNYEQALVFHIKATINAYMYDEVQKLKREAATAQKVIRKAGRMKESSRIKYAKISPVYLDNLEMLSEATLLRKPRKRGHDPANTTQLVQRLIADGMTVGFDAAKVDGIRALPRKWDELTVSEMRELKAVVTNIKKAVGHFTEIRLGDAKVSMDWAVAQAHAEISKNRVHRGPAKNVTPGTRVGEFLNGADGSLLRLTTMVWEMTGGDQNSIWYQGVELPLQNADKYRSDLLASVLMPIHELLTNLPKESYKILDKKIDGKNLFPNHGQPDPNTGKIRRDIIEPPETVRHLLHLLLNSGNASNSQRLLDGRGITRDEVIAAWNQHGTKELTEWVQKVWDSHKALVPLVVQTEVEDSGITPKMLDPVPLVTRWGILEGGYFKLTYDWRVKNLQGFNGPHKMSAAQLQAATLGDLMDNSYTRPATPQGHLIERVEKYRGVVQLNSFGPVLGALVQEIHDISHRAAIKQVGAFLMDNDVRNLLIDYMGVGKANKFLVILREVAQLRGMTLPEHVAEMNNLTTTMRGRTSRAIMGYRRNLPLGDLVNIGIPVLQHLRTNGVGGVDMATFSRSWTQFIGGRKAMTDFVLANSGRVRAMHNESMQKLLFEMKRLDSAAYNPLYNGPLGFLNKHAFWMVEAMQRLTTVPMWHAAYHKAIKTMSHEEAVVYADRVLEMSYSFNTAVNQSAIMRDRGFIGLSVLFYGWLNGVAYQHSHMIADPVAQKLIDRWDEKEEAWAGRDWKGAGGRVPRVAAQYLAFLIVAGVMAEFLMGHGPEKADGDTPEKRWAVWFTRKTIESAASTVPWGGDIAEKISSSKGRTSSIRLGPLTVMMEQITKNVDKAMDGDKDAVDRVMAGVEAVSMYYGIPLELIRTPKVVAKAVSGEYDDASQVMEAVTYGDKKEHPATIFNPMKEPVPTIKQLRTVKRGK